MLKELGHWQAWAQYALDRLTSEIEMQYAGIRNGLNAIRETGHEPYHTLKGWVCFAGIDRHSR